jgi:uncharacterized protein YxeA
MKALSILGLCIDIIGAFFIYLNSPKVSFETYLYNQEELTELEKKATRMHRMTQLGALLLVLGFALQILAIILQ